MSDKGRHDHNKELNYENEAIDNRNIFQKISDILNFDHQWTWKPDREILEDVKDEIFWSPLVDADKVTVTVDDGVVTLTGTVSTFSERQTAEHNAYEGGAKDVKNKLKVNYE